MEGSDSDKEQGFYLAEKRNDGQTSNHMKHFSVEAAL